MSEAGSRMLLLGVAALAGAATMTVELAAVRLLAPWFGSSAGVWTNVIGVILLALALGYLLGSRLAVRARPTRDLAWLLAAAAAWNAWLPALARPLCEALLPRELTLDQSAALLLWGSLAATLVLFLPPAALLGTVAPLCTEAYQRLSRTHAGTAGGTVLCASTLGSLAGAFGTTHWFAPALGLSWTFLAAALALLACSVMVGLLSQTRGGWLVAGALAAVTLTATWCSRLERTPTPEGVRVLAEAESRYQSIRVVEDTRWGETQRLLQVNEGLDSFQSVWVARKGLLGPGFYYDLFALPAWWARAEGPWRVAVIGLGAGTAFRVLEGASPPGAELELSGLEIDEKVVELGATWFDLVSERGTVLAGVDGRAGLRGLRGAFDLLVLDAYQNQVEIPAHLATFEAFTEMRARLAARGWIAVNVGGFGFDDPVVQAVATTLAAAFDGECVGYLTPRSRNIVLFARSGAPPSAPDADGYWFEGEVAKALLPSLSPEGCWRRFRGRAEEAPLRDDRSPLERLQQRSLEGARERLAAVR
jgi:spermidine synthase